MLASVKLGCNFDYDKLQNLAEQHCSLRQIMGMGRDVQDQDVAVEQSRILQERLQGEIKQTLKVCGVGLLHRIEFVLNARRNGAAYHEN